MSGECKSVGWLVNQQKFQYWGIGSVLVLDPVIRLVGVRMNRNHPGSGIIARVSANIDNQATAYAEQSLQDREAQDSHIDVSLVLSINILRPLDARILYNRIRQKLIARIVHQLSDHILNEVTDVVVYPIDDERRSICRG